ncbi:hypothetical protein FNF27_07050 [Cafeteria roenbergensis]|uniref:Uncharacterized protein n=1 Tax=Cafeteria roenbergensis TaxID=33653 RepID=A0A5A8DX02_CAFRO|nr:hypothetical protein FNF28_03054 [Cafeteria roenbergensis]KAA0169097.1 hypothetical protein FNF27_07050 [Cafeteria roenbergensis]
MVAYLFVVAWAGLASLPGVWPYALDYAKPAECFTSEFRSSVGVLKVRAVPQGSAKIRLTVHKGNACVHPDAAATVPAIVSNVADAARGEAAEAFVTPATFPKLESGPWSVLVQGEEVLPGQAVAFEIGMSNPLNGGPKPAAVASALALAAVALLASSYQ